MASKIGLYDIQGLDHISLWPLAIGWWIVFAVFTLVFLIGVPVYFDQKRKSLMWKFKILKELEFMENNLTEESSQKIASKVAELIRRLAIQRYSRNECANLQGKAWLTWLSSKDAAKVNWSDFSKILIEVPFQAPGNFHELESLKRMIQATKGWVK
jgi:hypothetical protein